jgi:4'-phosphopantetheinyl transferase
VETRPVTPTPQLADGECQVWFARVHLAAAGLESLDASERMRMSKLRRPADRDRYVTAHALLRFVVAGQLGQGLEPAAVELVNHCPRCGEGDHGQPRVPGPSGLFVSLSHADDWAAVAITRAGPVGIDIELIDALTPLAAGDAHTALSSAEREWWAGLPLAARAPVLAAVWTRKEALLKAAGTGFQTDPQALSLSPPGDPVRLLSWAGLSPVPAAALVDVSPDAAYAGSLAILTSGSVTVSEYVR